VSRQHVAGPMGTPSSAFSLVVAALLGAAAVPALGRPDFGAVADFLTSGRPTHFGAVAAVQLVVWTLVVALVCAQLAYGLRRPTALAREKGRRRLRIRGALLLGILVFSGGAIRHQTAQAAALCCGDVARADSLLR
jgi:hypothetical protein